MKSSIYYSFLAFCLSLFMFTSCSKDEIFTQKTASPVPAASVENCVLVGECQNILAWKDDINYALKNCFTEDQNPKCNLTNTKTTREVLLGQSPQYPTAIGGPLSPYCCISAVNINSKVGQYRSYGISNRPGGSYGPGFSHCSWLVTGYDFAWHASPYPTWIFKLTITYTKMCCPMKKIDPVHTVDLVGPEMLSNPGNEQDEWAVVVKANPGFTGESFVVSLLDESLNQMEAGIATRMGESQKFVYFPNQAILEAAETIRVE